MLERAERGEADRSSAEFAGGLVGASADLQRPKVGGIITICRGEKRTSQNNLPQAMRPQSLNGGIPSNMLPQNIKRLKGLYQKEFNSVGRESSNPNPTLLLEHLLST